MTRGENLHNRFRSELENKTAVVVEEYVTRDLADFKTVVSECTMHFENKHKDKSASPSIVYFLLLFATNHPNPVPVDLNHRRVFALHAQSRTFMDSEFAMSRYVGQQLEELTMADREHEFYAQVASTLEADDHLGLRMFLCYLDMLPIRAMMGSTIPPLLNEALSTYTLVRIHLEQMADPNGAVGRVDIHSALLRRWVLDITNTGTLGTKPGTNPTTKMYEDLPLPLLYDNNDVIAAPMGTGYTHTELHSAYTAWIVTQANVSGSDKQHAEAAEIKLRPFLTKFKDKVVAARFCREVQHLPPNNHSRYVWYGDTVLRRRVEERYPGLLANMDTEVAAQRRLQRMTDADQRALQAGYLKSMYGVPLVSVADTGGELGGERWEWNLRSQEPFHFKMDNSNPSSQLKKLAEKFFERYSTYTTAGMLESIEASCPYRELRELAATFHDEATLSSHQIRLRLARAFAEHTLARV